MNNKAICEESEVTVKFERSKPHDVLVVKVASLSTVLPVQVLWHKSQTDGCRSFWEVA